MSLNDQDIKNLKEIGTNLVRLGVMWESVETAPGVYDDEYLSKINDLINKLGKAGIYTIVDDHQDLFSRNLCGEGVPTFYSKQIEVDSKCPSTLSGWMFYLFGACKPLAEYNIPVGDDGLPIPSECTKQDFEMLYTAPEVASSFAALYANENGLQDKMMAYWEHTSAYFASNEYVLGYDPFNEPWPADIYHDFDLFYKTEKFDHTKVEPLMKNAHNHIRKHDDESILFFEPAQFPDTLPFLGGLVEHVGFDSTPGGDSYHNREVLNDHTYCCQAGQHNCDGGEPGQDLWETCRKFHASKLDVRSEDAEKLGVPLLITEFGACKNTDNCYEEISGATDAMDDHLVSWAHWQYKGFGDFTTTGSLTEGVYNQDGTYQDLKVKALARTYVPLSQGVPQSMHFDRESYRFDYTQFLDEERDASTTIYLNRDIFYPNGVKMSWFSDEQYTDKV
jgi:endoglycosylceramidase